jgi:hypothetical protein
MSHPYRRSYSATRQANWETNENYCYENVLIDEDYHNRLLLDMMDLAAFDFLIGNNFLSLFQCSSSYKL